MAPSLQCDRMCCVCTVKLSGAEFSQGAPSLPLVCDTTAIMSMPRSSKASWNHWIYCECTINNLDVWSTPDMSQSCLTAFMLFSQQLCWACMGVGPSRWAWSGQGHEWDKQVMHPEYSPQTLNFIFFLIQVLFIMTLDGACGGREDVRNVNKRTFWVCCRPSYWSGYFTSLLFCSLAVKWSDESNFCMPWSLMNILWSAQKSSGEKGWG